MNCMTGPLVLAAKERLGSMVLSESLCCDQTTIEVKQDTLKEVLSILKKECGFAMLIDLTAADYLIPVPHAKVIYWLHHPEECERIRVTVKVEREQRIPSITDLWKGANWYERELYDLFGIEVEGHPDLTRILMPDHWVGHPLRKDYPLTEEPVQFKHGVMPKVPSEIIRPRGSFRNIAQLGSNDKGN